METTSSKGRRHLEQLLCPECHEPFPTHRELMMHIELCIIEAIETEVRSLLEDERRRKPLPADAKTLNHGSAETSNQENTLMSVRCSDATAEEEEAGGSSAATIEKNTRTINGARGLKLVVSVERPAQLKRKLSRADATSSAPACAAEQSDSNEGKSAPTHKFVRSEEEVEESLVDYNFRPERCSDDGGLLFPCPVCEKPFTSSSAMEVHHHQHTLEKCYQCQCCSGFYVSKLSLGNHMLKHHPEQLAATSSQQPTVVAQGLDWQQRQESWTPSLGQSVLLADGVANSVAEQFVVPSDGGESQGNNYFTAQWPNFY